MAVAFQHDPEPLTLLAFLAISTDDVIAEYIRKLDELRPILVRRGMNPSELDHNLFVARQALADSRRHESRAC